MFKKIGQAIEKKNTNSKIASLLITYSKHASCIELGTEVAESDHELARHFMNYHLIRIHIRTSSRQVVETQIHERTGELLVDIDIRHGIEDSGVRAHDSDGRSGRHKFHHNLFNKNNEQCSNLSHTFTISCVVIESIASQDSYDEYFLEYMVTWK